MTSSIATTVPPYEEAVNSCARMVIAESVRWIEVVLVNHDLEFVDPLRARTITCLENARIFSFE